MDENRVFTAQVILDLNIECATQEDAERIAKNVGEWVEFSMQDYYVDCFAFDNEDADYEPTALLNEFVVRNVIEQKG